VVVNDLGSDVYGDGTSAAPAEQVVREIEAQGGRAVTSAHDIGDWDQAGELVQTAVDAFGRLDVLVNNAGIVADRTLANLTAEDWSSVIRVHLTGHAAPTAHAMRHWRNRAKAGDEVKASVVHTSSVAGFSGNFGQANYSAAKAGVIGLSKVVSIEGRSVGVRSNVISPSARTRMAATVPGSDSLLSPPSDPMAFDPLDPANVSPLVAWLAEAECPADDQIFHLIGNRLYVLRMPCIEHTLASEGRWTEDELDAQLLPRLVDQLPIETFFEGLVADRVPAS
jgi:NAD(P)-dependent dehydrogenase (short-subunit alcohol dehydrogenase family)